MHDLYVHFVRERLKIYRKRQHDCPQPWTDDPVLARKRFTNMYRVLDWESQFLIRELLPGASPHDTLMRCFLFRYTNRSEPWIAFRDEFGHYPVSEDLRSGALNRFWNDYCSAGNPIFGNAYKMFVGQENKGWTRLDYFTNMATERFSDTRFSTAYFQCPGPKERTDLLQTIPRCKGFMSQQIATDMEYSRWIPQQNHFVIPGPGAVVGARHIDPERSALEVIHHYYEFWQNEPAVHLKGHSFSLHDVQNHMCEFGKFVRYQTKPLPKKLYTPKHPGPIPNLTFPEYMNG